MEKILKLNSIFLDVDLKSQENVFEFIAEHALDNKIISNSDSLIKAFKERELESTTGFEDGFAIPHAKIKEANAFGIFVIRLKNGIDWKSMDGKLTNVIIGLIVPENKNDDHLTILSEVATKLMDEKFKNILLKSKDNQEILDAFRSKKQKTVFSKNKDGLNILAVTSCVTGIAHTYMAEEKLLQIVPTMGHNIRVETQGSKGVGTPFTQKEIEQADLVIFAVDINIDNSRFAGKKFYQVKVARAMKDPKGLVEEAIRDGYVLNGDASVTNKNFKTNAVRQKEGVMQHLLAGISYMIPVIVMGGIALAFSLGLAKAIWGPTANTMGQIPYVFDNFTNEILGKFVHFENGTFTIVDAPTINNILDGSISSYGIIGDGGFIYTLQWTLKENESNFVAVFKDLQWMSEIVSEWGPLHVIEIIGGAAFGLMIPILAGFIGNSISGRAAIAPAMVGAFIGNNAANFAVYPLLGAVQTPTGFIGAIIAGLLAGYAVKWINSWRVPRSLAPAMPIFFIPLAVGLGISILFIYVIGSPIGYVMGEFGSAIESAYKSDLGIGLGLGLGLLVGAMASFDMGGPINKIAFVTCSALITQGITEPMGAISAAIPVAPLGMGFSTIFFKKFFKEDERGLGVSAVIMGSIGISEGAIPFAIRDPKRAIASNVVGGMVAGAIAGAFMIQDYAAHGGPIVAILGAVPYGEQTAYYFIAVVAGVVTTTSMYGFWLLADAGKPGSVKQEHIAYLEMIKTDKKEKVFEIKEKISKLTFEIKALKKQSKLEGISLKEAIDKLTSKIVKLLEQKTKIGLDYNNKKMKAKIAYSVSKYEEKKAINSQKASIKEFKLENSKWYVSYINELNKNKLHTFTNKLEKQKYAVDFKLKKNTAKNKYEENIINDQSLRRKKYVTMYNQKLV